MVLNSFFNFIVSFLPDPEESKQELKDFYYLSLLKEQDGSFSIHGLWPQTTPDNYPTYCKKVQFDINKLNPIIKELNQYWYSTQEKNQDFWQHEWEKHGSCVWTSMTELEYFENALKLFNSANEKGLPNIFYNSKTNKCLIPVDKDLNFIGS
tara:strand:- start:85 stop:540 length:456 start_codon:yes stop_codon:yes gene_type:complete